MNRNSMVATDGKRRHAHKVHHILGLGISVQLRMESPRERFASHRFASFHGFITFHLLHRHCRQGHGLSEDHFVGKGSKPQNRPTRLVDTFWGAAP